MNRRDQNAWAQASRYLSLGLLLPAGTFVGYVIGYLLDRLFHTRVFLLVFLVLGTVGGFVALVRELDIKTKEDGS
jgi:F0F1-type ATP synthase assembly protein I